jgi:outer membrane protein assembly factor BamB
MRNFRYFGVMVAVFLALTPVAAWAYDWPQFGNNAQHNSNDIFETIINRNNVANLKKLFQVALPSGADGSPAYLDNVSTPNGTKDAVFVTTSSGHIIAFDAHSGTQIWSHQYGPGSCKINNGRDTCYTTSSAAIDPNREYVYSYGLEGYVHKYQVGNGLEITTDGWPELVTTKGFDEKGSSALTIATARDGQNYLYVANGGYPGDRGDYQGHLTTISLLSGEQHVFNATCSNKIDVHFAEKPASPDCSEVQTAIWPRPSVVYSVDTNKIYTTTGNGTFNPATFAWGDTVLALNPDGTGRADGSPLDSYTPPNYQKLQDTDADIGSTAPAILPTFNSRHLAVQGGKDALLHLIDLDNLSGQGGPGHTGGEVNTPIPVPQGGQVLTQPAVWTDSTGKIWLFVTTSAGVSGLQLTSDSNNVPTLTKIWQKSEGGTSPIIANTVLYYASSGNLRALDPTRGTLLWSDTSIGSIHWSSPIIANGIVYITDGGHSANSGKLTAFAIPKIATPTPTTPSSTTTANSGTTNSYSYNLPLLANSSNGFNTIISVQNPQNSPAIVSIEYTNSSGTALLQPLAKATIDPNGNWQAPQKLPLGSLGAAIIKSDQALTIQVTEITQEAVYTVKLGPQVRYQLRLELAFTLVVQNAIIKGVSPHRGG